MKKPVKSKDSKSKVVSKVVSKSNLDKKSPKKGGTKDKK